MSDLTYNNTLQLLDKLMDFPPEIWENLPDVARTAFWYNLFEQAWVQDVFKVMTLGVVVYLVCSGFSKILYALWDYRIFWTRDTSDSRIKEEE